ncbi:MAG: hypothetical protein KOO61_06240 [Spirochaetales bacterium]|nr:hypothetical protein [Spirochaetales bacterium]
MFRRNVLLGGVAIIALLAVFLLAACDAPTDPAPSEEEIAALEANIAAVEVLWSDSSHNNVWNQREGTNTYCARCHSPGNWDPDAMRGGPVPGSCFNCHLGPSLRTNALGNEAIAEEDFEGINCSTCHEEGHGSDIAIWNNATEGYDAVATSDELCGKCHVDGYGGFDAVASGPGGDSGTADGGGTATSLTEAGQDFMATVKAGMDVYNETDNSHATVSAVVDDGSITTTALTGGAANVWSAEDKYYIYEGPLVPGGIFDGTAHQIVVGGSAHPNEIGIAAADRGPSSCIECHDPHSLETSSCIACHEDLSKASNAMDIGHDDRMAKVTCVGCHSADPVLDAMGWVDAEARDVFTIGTKSVPRGGGAPVFSSSNTHLINRTAKACTDCHTADNSWGIPVIEAEQPSGRPF